MSKTIWRPPDRHGGAPQKGRARPSVNNLKQVVAEVNLQGEPRRELWRRDRNYNHELREPPERGTETRRVSSLPQPEGLPDSSRGSSAAIPPDDGTPKAPHPGRACQKSVRPICGRAFYKSPLKALSKTAGSNPATQCPRRKLPPESRPRERGDGHMGLDAVGRKDYKHKGRRKAVHGRQPVCFVVGGLDEDGALAFVKADVPPLAALNKQLISVLKIIKKGHGALYDLYRPASLKVSFNLTPFSVCCKVQHSLTGSCSRYRT